VSAEITLRLVAPLAGWCLPLAEVPDAVFAQGMAGDGVAIDPTGDVVHAPCDGDVVLLPGARHAVTIRHGGCDVVMHVGVDTVNLKGEGFELLVAAGARVRAGDPLLRFDLEAVARRAPSLVTPVIVASGGVVRRRAAAGTIQVGDFLMEVALDMQAEDLAAAERPGERREFRVPFEHGFHVRPAALVAAALKPFAAEVTLHCRGRRADARSAVSMMALGVRCGDEIEVHARGTDAAAALRALEQVLALPVAAVAPAAPPAAPRGRRRIAGVIASPGLALGPAAPWAQPEIAVAERGAGFAGEAAALADAIAAVRGHLESLCRDASGERQALLAGHAELVEDPDLRRQAEESMRGGKSAGFAWREATRATAAMLAALDDSRMRERAADLRDLENQVLLVLSGKPPGGTRELGAGAIVLADELLPSQMMQLERQAVAGVCIARGGATSHVAILAAAAGIPTLVAAGADILAIAEGTPLVLDAEHGWLDVDPPSAERAVLEQAAAQRAAGNAADLAGARQPARTRDGVRVVVNANLGALGEARGAVERGADGCGLLRTEFLFLDRREPPGESEQAEEYQRIATALEGRPLGIRTMDVGGDKPIAYLPMPHEENPALGLRGLRASLASPELLRTQLRAILSVRPAGQCRVLLPMVTELDELLQVREMLAECARELGETATALGVMIETPASALLAAQLAPAADFLSIGTNDLSQYTLAMDRGHPELARRLDALHPAVLRLVALVAEAGREHGKSVSICGALGSDVVALPILIGLGVHEVSAAPAMIPRMKRTVRSLDASACADLARRALEQSSAAAVRGLAALSAKDDSGGPP